MAVVIVVDRSTGTVILLLTLLIKARVQIVAGSTLGIFLLLLQMLMFLAVSSGWMLAARNISILCHAATPARSDLMPRQVIEDALAISGWCCRWGLFGVHLDSGEAPGQAAKKD
jgi:hypothetical protein